MKQLTYSDTLTVVSCGNCHIRFAMPKDLQRQVQRDPSIWFWCPRGCKIHYYGKSEADKLRDEVSAVEAERDAARELARRERGRRATEERRVAAYKGHLTRMRNRVANGICPKTGCQRSFTNLYRHVRDVHPDLVAEVLDNQPEGSNP